MAVNIQTAITELHKAFHYLNRDLFQGKLPEPAILIQNKGNKKLVLGWCSTKEIWVNEATKETKYEINIVAEYLNRGIYPVMATLLHEMVHLHNLVNEIQDTSRGNTYHNKRFKETAEAHGLVIEYADKIGYSLTKLQNSTMNLINGYGLKEEAFSFARLDINQEEKEKKKKKSSVRKYVCPCGTIIRATKEVRVVCLDCGGVFEEELENVENGENEQQSEGMGD